MPFDPSQIVVYLGIATVLILITPGLVIYLIYRDLGLAINWWLAVFLWITKDRSDRNRR